MKKTYLLASLFFIIGHLFAQNNDKAFNLFTPIKKQLINASDATLKRIATLEMKETVKRHLKFSINVLKILEFNKISIELFDGKQISVEKKSLKKRGKRSFTWSGDIQGQKGKVILSVFNGDLAGHIFYEGIPYHILYLGDGIYALEEFNAHKFPPCGNTDIKHDHDDDLLPHQRPMQKQIEQAKQKKNEKGNDSTRIDVLVVYSIEANAAFGSIRSEIQSAIDLTNLAYANSDTTAEVRLAGARALDYNESGDISVDLSRIRSKGDGFIDEVHSLREAHCADLVSLWISTDASSCGLASLITDPTASTAESFGFSTVVGSCATGNLSFPHELGHNMGATHDIVASPGDGYAAYSHGLTVDLSYRTVMAYSTACTGNVCTRVPYFSNPDVLYLGVATGNSTEADNARTFDETLNATAKYRADACVRSFFEIDGNDQEVDKLVEKACFVATAAYGSPYHHHIISLRSFRDKVLSKFFLGRLFIKSYYKLSPTLADYIGQRPFAMKITRVFLAPIVYSISFPIYSFAILLSFISGVIFLRRRSQI